ncbi:uncharacterized protein LOC127709071 isoform X1 [Mytilus californianus]|uniref:uncharacterized protein LOC127709071 isoform X1 n=2 Tax=Mytilus californianus TaxID=6549 RepID=UPI002245E666|nr:uncharacterized protein LOC127709071 isoform X1 [Mytilus californianus]
MIRRKCRKIRNFILCLAFIFCISLLRMNNDKNQDRFCPSDTLFETVHIFNSIAEAKSEWKSVEYIMINVLDGSTFRSIFECCIFGENRFGIHRSEAVVEDSFNYRLIKPELIAKKYKCSVKNIKFKPVHIGLVENGNSCDPCVTVTSVIYPVVMEHGAGVCAKIAFNYLNPSYLIEWFEYQIMMEVDTVVVMLQYINDEALAVFKYYKQKGLLEILPYPIKLPGKTDRGFESTNWHFDQSVHDEQVAVYTCQAYFQGYELVAVIDFDEFIVQDKFISYKTMLKSELLPLYPLAAAFTFNVSFFITDWGFSGVEPLLTSQYIKRTSPRYERFKTMYIPKRTQDVNTHYVHPKPGYKRILLRSHNVVLHHYRKCPHDQNWKYCMYLTPTIDKKMLKLMSKLLMNVMAVKKLIGSL